ncbi:hypothetical protein [Rathayibacter sp. AY1E6]|uniref:hypothetical protein n=1 Tax=Rathayibacter sp. AY1E6 TaxID=2080554 RepID=UPI0015E2FF9B|nr:hypothetical protein [Rathayibacter sp. AY1E6]
MPERSLGIYADTAQLDHDTRALLDSLVGDLTARGVDYELAWRAVRRVARGGAAHG